VSYEWDFGDGDAGSGETVTHVYTAAGEYEVILTVVDDDGASVTDTVVVIVQTPEDATQDLISDIEDMDLPGGLENSLTSKLENAIDSLEKGNLNAAANKLGAFINQVEAQRGKKLTDEQADELIAAAQRIIDSLQTP
jgi:PKD repeat protein